MRVLRVIPTIDPDVGGPSNSAVNAAIAESRAGAQTTMVFTGDASSETSTERARARLSASGVRTLMFPRPRLHSRQAGLWGVSPSLLAWIWRHVREFDVVHVHYVWALSTLGAVVFAKAAGRPVVLTAHESLTSYDINTASGSSLKRRAKLALRRLIMLRVNTVVCASELERSDSVQPGEHAVVIGHPVVEYPRSSPLPEPQVDTLTIGYLGRLHPKKNVDILLRALSAIPDARLIACGDGDPVYREELHALARELGVDARIDWRGHVDESGRAELFRDTHVVVMASAYECFGMAGAEALASGVPVVVTESTGLAPLVRAADAGAVVEAGNVHALARALTGLMDDQSTRRSRRERALAASSSSFSFQAYGSAILDVYRGRTDHARESVSGATLAEAV